MLTLENVNVYYGGIHALRDVSLRVEAGEVVTLDAPTALEVDDAARNHRPAHAAQRPHPLRGRGHHRPARPPAGGARHLDGAGRARIFANLTVLENLEMARIESATRQRSAATSNAASPVPAAARACEAAVGHVVRRRAADAGDCAGADVAAEAVAAR